MEEIKKSAANGVAVHKVLTVFGIAISVLLIPILIINMTLIIKGTIDDTRPPSIAGITPLVVLSGSMDDGSYGAIEVGDLILVKKVDPEKLRENEVVAFMEEGYAVTHRIVEVKEQDGSVIYVTRGDANNTNDTLPLFPENVLGQYFYRVPKLGNFVLFLQTTTGMLCFVGVPVILFIVYDLIRRRMFTKSEQAKQEQLRKELENLKRRPQQANAYKPVEGRVLKEPNNPSASLPNQVIHEPEDQLHYERPLPPLPPEMQPMSHNTPQESSQVPARSMTQDRPVVKKSTVQIKKVTKSKNK